MAKYLELGKLLQKFRKDTGITQEDLASVIGKDASLISHYERGLSKPPEDSLEKIITHLAANGVKREALEELYNLGEYTSLQNSSEPMFRQAAKLFDEISSDRSLRTLFEENFLDMLHDWEIFLRGNRELRRAEWEDSIETFEDLWDILDDDRHYRDRLTIRVLHGLAKASRYLGETEFGLNYINDAIDLAKKVGKDENKILSELLLDRGDFHRRLNKWDVAAEDYSTSRTIIRKIHPITREDQDIHSAIVERKLAGTHLFQGHYEPAIRLCNKSIKKCVELKSYLNAVKGKQHLAWAFSIKGDWDEAINIHKEIISHLDEYKADLIFQAKSQRYLADVYLSCGIYSKAIELYELAEGCLTEHLREIGGANKDSLIFGLIKYGKGSALNNFPELKKDAEENLMESLRVQKKIGARLHEALTLSELGVLYLNYGDHAKSTRVSNEALAIFKELKSDYYTAIQNLRLSKIELIMGNISDAISQGEKCLEIAVNRGYQPVSLLAKLIISKAKVTLSSDVDLYYTFSDISKSANAISPYLLLQVLQMISEKAPLMNNEEDVFSEIVKLTNNLLEDGLEKKYPNLLLHERSKERWFDLLFNIVSQYGDKFVNKEFQSGRGLIIGVGDYSKLNKLRKTTADAKDFYELLLSKGYKEPDLKLLIDGNANKKSIIFEFQKLAEETNPDETLIIFFSGHGAQIFDQFQKGEYLCLVEFDQSDIENSAISSEALTNAIRKINAKHVVVFLDACHSGGVGNPKSQNKIEMKAGFSEEVLTDISKEGRVVIASCAPDEASWELAEMDNGLFSHYLLEGLKGKANNHKGFIGIMDLFMFISDKVPNHNVNQHPLFKGEIYRNFPITKG